MKYLFLLHENGNNSIDIFSQVFKEPKTISKYCNTVPKTILKCFEEENDNLTQQTF